MSARSSSAGSASNEPEAPPKRWASAIARSRRRLATNIVVTPWSCNARAVSSAVSPAPIDQHVAVRQVAERVARGVDRDGGDAGAARRRSPSRVRTRLPVASAARNSLLVIGPVVRAASARS